MSKTKTRYNPQGTKLSAAAASAGRANADAARRRQRKLRGVSVVGGSLAEFGRACDRMLAEHVPGYRVLNFSGQDVTEQMLAAAPPKRQRTGYEPRPVQTVFWKSKPQAAVWCSGVA